MKSTTIRITLIEKNQISRLAVVGGLLLLAFGTFLTCALNAQQPDRGFQAANSYASTGLETINTSNGNMMLNIPLASLPKGRGTSPGYTVILQYNSKLWDMSQTTRDDGQPNEYGNGYYSLNTVTRSERGGWTIHSSFSLLVTNRLNSETPDVCHMHDPVEHLNFIWKVEMDMPDGSVKQFFPETGKSSTVGMGTEGYSNVDPNGVTGNAYQDVHPGNGVCYTGVSYSSVSNTGMTYITMDGSRLRLFIPYVANSPAISAGQRNWKLYFPDGTMVENAPSSTVGQRMTDRNGNFIEHTADGIVDDLGRSIKIENATNGDTLVKVKGVNGELVQTTLKWSTRYVHQKYRKAPSDTAPQEFRYEDFFGDVPVVTQIVFPQQLGTQTLDFEYNGSTEQYPSGYTDGWGEISKITAPTTAYSDFTYDQPGQGGGETIAADVLARYTLNKNLHYHEQYDGNTPTSKSAIWNYGVSPSSNWVQGPDGGFSGESLVYYPFGSTTWNNGLSLKTTNADGSITERIWAYDMPYALSGGTPVVPGQWGGVGGANAYIKTEFTTLADANGNISSSSPTAIKDYKYDKNGNVLEVYEYDWINHGSVSSNGAPPTGLPTGLTLKRKTLNTYYNQAADANSNTNDSNVYNSSGSPKLKNVIKSTEIQDSSGNPKARSEFFYDDADNTGNLIETRVWDNTKAGLNAGNGSKLDAGNSVSTQTDYDSHGNPVLITDANGNQTHMEYGVVSGPDGDVTDLYPTQVKTAYQKTIERTASSTYDFYTGLVTSTTDEDNGLTNATEYDDLGRPTKAITAQGNALESWTTTEYDAVNRRVIVRSDLETKGDGKKVGTQFYDELGRVRLTKTLEDAATQSAVNETDGIKVQTRYAFDNPTSPSASNGTYSLTSNPYRAATSGAASGETTMGWSRSYSTRTGKHGEATTFSGASLPAPWGSSSTSTGTVTTDADTDRTLVSDQAGKKRISKMNGLGQLSDVWEVTPSDGSTVSVTFPGAAGTGVSTGYQTSYVYDTLGNLTTVNQGSQTRSFTYSSLSRLLSAQNPESGTLSYGYDPNGNLTAKSQLRSGTANVLTSYSYDALNRILQRSYSTPNGTPTYYQATPTVDYFYDDPAIAHSKGKLTKVSSSVSTTDYVSFDVLGRVTRSKQTTDGVVYGDDTHPMTYAYNLSGTLVEQQYPSGRVVKNTLDANGDLSQVESKKTSASGYWTYANSFIYNPAGAVTSIQLGNGHWEGAVFNSRLQPTQISLGTTQGSTSLLRLDYSYGAAQNNGNVQSQTITAPTVGSYTGFTATQNYTYDSLNRINDAAETISNTQTWKQTFTYDRFGNRNFDEANTTTLTKSCGTSPNFTVCTPDRKKENPSVNTANNRLNASDGYSYDLAGNTTADANSQSYIYDGENKIVQASNGGGALGYYYYDGDGKRVKKVVPNGETTIFLYDASGKTVSEYSTELANTPLVSYLTSDNLGTPRINTNAGGDVIARHDYHPFGEEISSSQRTPGNGYDPDEIRKKFTGYERDSEIRLDFAQARYYSKDYGRFTTPDPLLASGNPNSPKSWNRFVYSQNNPLKFTDPTGLVCCTDAELIQIIKAELRGSWTTNGKDEINLDDRSIDKLARQILPAAQTQAALSTDAQNTINDSINTQNDAQSKAIDDDMNRMAQRTPEKTDPAPLFGNPCNCTEKPPESWSISKRVVEPSEEAQGKDQQANQNIGTSAVSVGQKVDGTNVTGTRIAPSPSTGNNQDTPFKGEVVNTSGTVNAILLKVDSAARKEVNINNPIRRKALP